LVFLATSCISVIRILKSIVSCQDQQLKLAQVRKICADKIGKIGTGVWEQKFLTKLGM
jgi:hypothetical protein